MFAWLQSLYEEGKVTHERFRELLKEFPIGYMARKRDSMEVEKDAYEKRLQSHVDHELAILSPKIKKPRGFPEVEKFLSYFDDTPRFRRPILALVGGTRTGKSMLAASVLRQLAERMSLKGFLEVTVENDPELDFSDLDIFVHAGVLLDGVGDVDLLRPHREVLQGRPKVTKGGRSATMVYAYPFTLCRRAVIATLDLSARNLHLFKRDHWFSDPENVIVLRLSGPAWETELDEEPPAQSRQDIMQGWTAEETCRFLMESDLEGPAAVCRSNGVSGEDLVRMSENDFIKDLLLTPFAARKVEVAATKFLDCV